MRIIYAGTPEFAVPALQGLIDAGLTQELDPVVRDERRPRAGGSTPHRSTARCKRWQEPRRIT